MPGSIVNIGLIKKETSISVIGVFQQAYADITFNINHSFSLYLCENPCRKLTQEQLCLFKGFFELMEKLYNQTDHCFRQQIIKNCVQCLFWDMYAEVHNRLRADVSSNRQEVLYKQFIQLVQKNCHVQREISFYAERLHITSRYLLKIIQNIGNCTPKSIIDQYNIRDKGSIKVE